MGKIINAILSSNPVYLKTLESLKEKNECDWIYISKKKDFNTEFLKEKGIKKIFVTHWSYKIPEFIFNEYEIILFHMTDLPFGRGGSPLQNLIKLGHSETKISAIKVVDGIDEGPIYLKKKLSLDGTAKQIFIRSSSVITKMIIKINKNDLVPKPQLGQPTYFKRRTPNQSEIIGLNSIKEIYDHVRMLDYEGYPKAFLETPFFKFEFYNSSFDTKSNSVLANVRIIKK